MLPVSAPYEKGVKKNRSLDLASRGPKSDAKLQPSRRSHQTFQEVFFEFNLL
jgi:hypothetical protein